MGMIFMKNIKWPKKLTLRKALRMSSFYFCQVCLRLSESRNLFSQILHSERYCCFLLWNQFLNFWPKLALWPTAVHFVMVGRQFNPGKFNPKVQPRLFQPTVTHSGWFCYYYYVCICIDDGKINLALSTDSYSPGLNCRVEFFGVELSTNLKNVYLSLCSLTLLYYFISGISSWYISQTTTKNKKKHTVFTK